MSGGPAGTDDILCLRTGNEMGRQSKGCPPGRSGIGAKHLLSFLEDAVDLILGQNDPHQRQPPRE